ncbi:hypothetical protein PBI_GAIA_64 [Mycobacterium phage Gaia]|uniref:Uncharacterized protein n=1 Tax=Mycobacterium phage Gaia TaxID=1486472 RepID=A0A068F3G5_9CAUD|nr:hypothetical protein VC46_gp169 [Mycobacterium phage Gaia]AID58883.1 hypothetical protein PBI_GAIA_64 [Mycobacterium phage Gaia]AYR00004.1 hypothetical protein PBI_NEBKISS_65 [Mycobacterium phage Nebkiss]
MESCARVCINGGASEPLNTQKQNAPPINPQGDDMHRLTDINKPNVVFVGFDGTVWRTPGNGNPRIRLNDGKRSVSHGELFD